MPAVIILFPALQWLAVVFAMVGKFFISVSFGLAWLYVFEAYPTSIRGVALLLCSLWARVGAIIASYVPLLVRPEKEMYIMLDKSF